MSSELFEALLTIITIFLILPAVVLLIAYYIYHQIMKLPENTPDKYNRQKNENIRKNTVVACIGDSITHGRMSTN